MGEDDGADGLASGAARELDDEIAAKEAALVAGFVAQADDTTESPVAEVGEEDGADGLAAGTARELDDEVTADELVPSATIEVAVVTTDDAVAAAETEFEDETHPISTAPDGLPDLGADEDGRREDLSTSTALGEQLGMSEEVQDVNGTDHSQYPRPKTKNSSQGETKQRGARSTWVK